ncbi:MAG TPA: PEP-CTERM sorting domain-containing protein [Bryobacteraceae bacterium]|nr:PEP-CTERM sorting domain-containing protein [Bryobacteraceae bacterium]
MKPRNQAESLRNSQLEKKIAAYTLAGAAALAAPAAAHAGTIDFVPVNQTITQPGSYVFNLSGPSAGDITLTAAPTTLGGDPGNIINFSTANGAAVADDGGPFSADASALTFGETIDPTTGNWGTSGKLGDYDTVTMASEDGVWTPGMDAYLGFYFQGTGGPQAGWAEISMGAADASFDLISYAYETDANTPINAGEVPEPSTMALVALGGAGLLALRRRRAARA